MKDEAFKKQHWPHFACFVDASNVARRRYENPPKAYLADLDAVVAALRKLRYVPIVVSDKNLFQLIDEPYKYQDKYTKFPHSVADRQQADTIVLRALRRLPEAACVTNDRYSKPDEQKEFADVLSFKDCFYRHGWEGDAPLLRAADGSPMPGAHERAAARLSES